MDDLRIIQAFSIATIGGVIGTGFLYLRRRETGPAVNLWAWSWLCFFGSLLASVDDAVWAEVLAHALGTAFPVLLLAGTLAYTGRIVPRWLGPAGLAVGVVRGLASVAGLEWLRTGLVFAVEAPADFVAAGVVLTAFRRDQRAPAVAALAVCCALFGVLELTNALWLRPGVDVSNLYVAFGSAATLMLGLAQILALLERAHDLHATDLGMLRTVAQAVSREPDVASLARRVLEVLRERLDLAAGGVWVLDRDGTHLECIHYFGNRSPLPDEISRIRSDKALASRAMKSGEPFFLDADQIPKDAAADQRWSDGEAYRTGGVLPLRDGDAIEGVIAVARRIPQRFGDSEQRLLGTVADEFTLALRHARAVERLADERRVLSSVIDSSPTGVLVADRLGRVEILNATFAEHMGERDPRPWIGRRIDSMASEIATRFDEPDELARGFAPADYRASFTVSVMTTVPSERDLLIFTGPILDASDAPLGRVWVSRDVSDEHRMQEELRQSQKMETLGTLAGGVAHDFNNQLTAILGNARLLLERMGEDASARESLVDVERAAEHCAQLTRSLLAFARRAPLSRVVLDPVRLVDEIGSLLRSLLPSTVRFELSMPASLPSIEVDPTQLQQILFNLVVNARDALGGEGRIRLAVCERMIAPSENDEPVPGAYVEFAVIDDGPGMDALTRERIFEPFFTTRGAEGGTGLGLAVVYGAARAHGGWVEVESARGSGSAFRVLLPIVDAAEPATGRLETTSDVRGDETVLLADDESTVRRLARVALEQRGFSVIAAANGREAVELLRKHADEIDAVVLDITMPELDGYAALEQIRRLRPGMPALLMSGLPPTGGVSDANGTTDYIAKPFGVDELGRRVRGILDAAE